MTIEARPRSEAVDELVRHSAAQRLAGASYALAAVGGYGRRELFPYSDIDLLLLVESEADLARLKEPFGEFLRVLWDDGLRVSQSARTVAECCRLQNGNIELHISLLDLRFLHGDLALFHQLSSRLPETFRRDGPVMVRKLAEMVRERHAKYNNTVYHLEPNIKEAPGGIRDLHLLRWLAALLPQHEAIRESLEELKPAEEFLASVRFFLHEKAGRDNNLLTFELQDEAAKSLPSAPLSPEAWMRLYYRHARRLFQSSTRALEYAEAQDTSLLRQFRDWRSRLSTAEFTVSRERILLRNPAETLESPEGVLRLFSLAGRHGLRLAWDTQRRLRSEQERIAIDFRDHPPEWAAWREFFSQPNTSLALHEMQETGLLGAVLPEWNSIDSLVVRDFYHRYTVDEHTLIAIHSIDEAISRQPGSPARFHEFELEEDDPAVLRLALLIHDLGKGPESVDYVPSDHVRGSVQAGRKLMARLETPEQLQQQVLFLVAHHLDLSLVMAGRDLDDPATARFLTSRTGTQEDLRRLTLVTYADINAVNPTAMTPWRLEQLWRVYTTGLEQLTRELASDRLHEEPVASELQGFLEGFPRRYLRTHTREQIERHREMAEKSSRDGVAVEISREAGAYVMTVAARDVPGLFASLCGALASFGMNIVKADAASNRTALALDFIRFTDPMRTLELNPGEISRLEWTVECVVRGSIEVGDLLKRRPRIPGPLSKRRMKPTVRFDDEASDSSTLIEFAGEDRPGLLYDLASAISRAGCNIELVMIDTEAHRAFDVFYVTRQSEKLNKRLQQRLATDMVSVAAAESGNSFAEKE